MLIELVPWDDEGRALEWSWPGASGACATCATRALFEGVAVEASPAEGPRPCTGCGARIAAVDADGDGDGGDILDVEEADALDGGEFDPAELGEIDAWFGEPVEIVRPALLDERTTGDGGG